MSLKNVVGQCWRAQLQGFVLGEDKEGMTDTFDQFAALMIKTATELRKVGNAKTEHFGEG